MKKIKIFTLLLLIAVFSLDAQNPEVTTGRNTMPVAKLRKRSIFTNLEYADANEIITSDYKGFDKIFTVYDFQTMNMTETFILKPNKINGKSANWTRHVFHSDKISAFYSYYDKSTDVNTVYGKIINRQDEIIEKPIKLMIISAKTKNKLGVINKIQSSDNSKMLFLRTPDAIGKTSIVYKKDNINFGLFDINLNKIIDKEMTFPDKYGDVVLHDVLLTNKGGISLIVSINYDGKLRDANKNHYWKYKILALDKDQESFIEVADLESENYFTTCKGFISNDTSNLITFFGLYNKGSGSPDDKSKKYEGFYTLLVNSKTWKIKNIYYNEINDKQLKKILNASQQYTGFADKGNEKAKDVVNLSIDYAFYNKDGSITIYAEFKAFDLSCGKSGCSYIYLFSEIVLFEIDKDGKLTNTVNIPKGQHLITNDQYGSYVVLNNGKNKYIVFTDSKLNYKDGIVDYKNIFYKLGKSTLSCVTIDSKGKFKKEAITEGGKLSPVIDTQNYFVINGNTFITLGIVMKYKELSLVKIEY